MHGGDIYRNRVSLDFSVNVNPLGLPDGVRRALHDAVEECRCYPDIQTEGLRQAIGEMTGAEAEYIVCGNGASELFTAIVHGVRPEKVLIPVPAFSGYERAASAGGGKIRYYKTGKEENFRLTDRFLRELGEDTDLLFLANPCNPAGNLTDASLLEKIISVCSEKGIRVVLDECFIEFPAAGAAHSFARRICEFPGLIVVRAFTKIFAMPGVRLGYLICGDVCLREKIRAQLPEWNVSVFAQRAGIAAAKERKYVGKTAGMIAEERAYLKAELEKQGLTVYPSDANFLLVYGREDLGERLLRQRILIRDCSDFKGLSKGFYRIAVRLREENERLITALREIADGKNQYCKA